ncbi:TetR/AcrR family transcriptional regulator [Paenibacillus albicereus]|uniref:TetR/AcrR family transcriptional regulator n=1 Tax=Paenibacillus albicereus TaxID=2726185 RepID=A0A6H2H2Z9_9BACL|nr:TetR/AcrR family transcriptional regulator [Paenibacillus albicereus]QJC53969.1 TetR/AcrR family transcriptional regulator [Paenibacillus albicereus]
MNRHEPWLEELLQGAADEGKTTARQARIVEAAVELFAEKGFAAASTSEIAVRAGVAEGTIFRHFKTKQELLLRIAKPAIVKLLAPFLLREFKDVLDVRYDSYGEFVQAMLANRLEFIRQNPRLVKMIVQELPLQPDLQEQVKQTLVPLLYPRLKAAVERFQEQGQLAPLPPPTVLRLTASGILGYIAGHLAAAAGRFPDWDDEAELQATIAFIVKGLSP